MDNEASIYVYKINKKYGECDIPTYYSIILY